MLNKILSAIYKDATDYDTTTGTARIMHKGEQIGSVDYKVSVEVMHAGSTGNYDYPPEREESEMTLESATVTEFYNTKGIELTNVKAKLNQLLKENENTILP